MGELEEEGQRRREAQGALFAQAAARKAALAKAEQERVNRTQEIQHRCETEIDFVKIAREREALAGARREADAARRRKQLLADEDDMEERIRLRRQNGVEDDDDDGYDSMDDIQDEFADI